MRVLLIRQYSMYELQMSANVVIHKPLLKWVGGKTQIIESVLSHFPSSMRDYYEPFLGGGSVLLALLSYRQAGKIAISGTLYASDLNANLIGFYRSIQNVPEEFIAEVHRIVEEYSSCAAEGAIHRAPTTPQEAHTSRESYYYWIRSQFNRMSKEEHLSVRGSAMFLFLNKTCFRGLYREGPNGYNVPYGHYSQISIMDEAHVRSISQLIQGVVFNIRTYDDVITSIQPNDFAYLDPPYAPETKTSFVSYTGDGFCIKQHETLFRLCQQRAINGCRWLMSNADVALVRDTFADTTRYTIHGISCRRSIHSKKPDSKTNEVFICVN